MASLKLQKLAAALINFTDVIDDLTAVSDDLQEDVANLLAEENTNSTVDDRERRFDLGCSFCRPNKGENEKRKAKPDKYKSKRKGR